MAKKKKKLQTMEARFRRAVHYKGKLKRYTIKEFKEYINKCERLTNGHSSKDLSLSSSSSKLFPLNFLYPFFLNPSLLIPFTLWMTSKRRACPGIPYCLSDGDTARHIVFSVLDLSATTRLVFNGSNFLKTHSTDA